MEKDIQIVEEVKEVVEKKAKKEFVVVSVGILNLRAGPSFKDEVSKVLVLGTKLEVIKKHNGWVLVKHTEGDKSLKGYVKEEFVESYLGV